VRIWSWTRYFGTRILPVVTVIRRDRAEGHKLAYFAARGKTYGD
jgi:hypothetical protein